MCHNAKTAIISRREIQQTQTTYQSCDIVQHLDLRQEEQISLESKNSEEVRKEKTDPQWATW